MAKSPEAAATLMDAIAEDAGDAGDVMGETDCPHGCVIEPDGTCSHGFESAALTAGVI